MQKLKHIHPVKRWVNLSTTTKAMSILVVVALGAGGLFSWAQWQDAKNKEFLEQIAADFSTLQISLEEELGVEVENQSGCFTTSEKFNEGKTACYLRLEPKTNDRNQVEIMKNSIRDSGKFTKIEPIDETGYNAYYQDIKCSFGDWPIDKNILFLECPVPVRAGNADYVRELF